MASPTKGIFAASDILYLATFTAGMAAFWLSSQAVALLPSLGDKTLSGTAGIVVSGGVYGLGMFILAFAVTRRFGKPTLIATGVAIALGLLAAQIIVRLAAGQVNDKFDLSILTFILYLCYGSIYAGALALGRRFDR